MKKIVILLILTVIIFSAYPQEVKTNFTDKKNQHSVSLEIASVSYTYVHRFAPKLRLGARVQLGMAAFFSPTWPLETHPAIVDLVNFQILYRTVIAKSFYFDAGILASYPSYIKDWDLVNSFGLTGSAYYHYKKFHIGFSFQVRGFEEWYYDSYTPEGDPLSSSTRISFIPVVSPLIIGISF